jgi:hypothetical protein
MTGHPSHSELESAFEKRLSRYLVGIDLGTTNCAVAFVDSQSANPSIEVFQIEQLVDIQTRQRSDTLPSFHYELTTNEASEMDSRFVFSDDGKHPSVVGIFARQRGLQMPGRCVASAKSWLCHPLVDRTSEMLPWSGDDGVHLISPVRASSRYLEHIRREWDRVHPTEPLSQQDVAITLPASFDEVARQLTIQAATEAGLHSIVLIEEPQAAFYAWLYRNRDSWQSMMRPGQSILVCDIGGGTTDFTLIRVVESSQNETSVQTSSQENSLAADQSQSVASELRTTFGLHRVAVGEHLMLGGDNLDLALAKALEQRLLAESPNQDRLKARQWDALKSQCRVAKETLLSENPPENYSLSIPGTGTKLIENARTLTISREWAHQWLIEGFFGRVNLESKPVRDSEGFQEFGLPYAADPNVHKHLASFLWEHRWDGRSDADRESLNELQAARPDWLLFNGGVLESSQVRNAIIQQIEAWFNARNIASAPPSVAPWKVGLLEGNRLDLAVAQGAAYFGLVRRGLGVRIDARLARAYYLQVDDSPPRVMCIMPANAMPLDRFRLDQHPFLLTLGQPVQFPLYQSSTHLIHAAGEIVDVDPQSMTPLPPIRTVLEFGNRKSHAEIPVVIEAAISEIGTLGIQLVHVSDETAPVHWQLEFDVRGQTADGAMIDSNDSTWSETSHSAQIDAAIDALEQVFGDSASAAPKEAMQIIAKQVGQGRRDWSPSLLRSMWRYLVEHSESRKRSPEHEARWLNLVGWFLRPGFGVAADDWRVGTTWRLVHNKLMHRSAANASETIVLWRRIAGGFTPGQQRALFQDCWPRVRSALAGGASSAVPGTNVTTELLRLVGSLEWLRNEDKSAAAELCLQSLTKKKLEPLHGALLWTIGRLGSRVPVYANLQQVLNASRVESYLERLMRWDDSFVKKNTSMVSLCMMLLARRTEDRYRDIPNGLRERVVAFLRSYSAPEMHLELIATGGRLDEENAASIVGESLPLGFRLGKQ